MTRPALKAELIEHLPCLRAFARSLVQNPTEADELVRDTLVQAYANTERFSLGADLKTWLFTTVRDRFYSALRVTRSGGQVADGAISARLRRGRAQVGVVDPDDFKQAFSRLGPHHREALSLVWAAGCSDEEAARICGCAVASIKRRAYLARLQLIQLLNVCDQLPTIGEGSLAGSVRSGQ